MPRIKNAIPTEQLTISTTPQVVEYLGVFVATGLYGKNAAEVAEHLVRTAIRAEMGGEVMQAHLSELMKAKLKGP